jgi:hypothetical protein
MAAKRRVILQTPLHAAGGLFGHISQAFQQVVDISASLNRFTILYKSASSSSDTTQEGVSPVGEMVFPKIR